jgi:hypothetical protein
MPTIDLLGGEVQIYQRDNSRFWQARASVGGKQRQFSTKREGQELASRAAEDWYLTLQGKLRAGVLEDGPTFKKAADQFLMDMASSPRVNAARNGPRATPSGYGCIWCRSSGTCR